MVRKDSEPARGFPRFLVKESEQASVSGAAPQKEAHAEPSERPAPSPYGSRPSFRQATRAFAGPCVGDEDFCMASCVVVPVRSRRAVPR